MRARLAIALLALGCLDFGTLPFDPQKPSPPSPAPPVGATDAATPPPGTDAAAPPALVCPREGGPGEVLVTMDGNGFQPMVVTGCAGDTVTWRNDDSKEHTVITGTPSAPDGLVASPKIYFGQTFSHVFDVPATYVYYCSTHKKKMKDARVIIL